MVGGAIILVVASIAYAWYAGNAMAGPGQAAPGFRSHGLVALLVAVVLLLLGLGLVWAAAGFGAAIVGALVCMFILPHVAVPVLKALHFIPPADE